eukprot:TRINITY_DN4715_c0_g3_i2.p2 TRINITY_DN4715_c0_g3~~TRINITY_DN4715_c0_g3_i2.p2  ORF type:complete len:133 (-),score=18.63 TRINITY_DN4715_c0_g3_i2:557-955(-)
MMEERIEQIQKETTRNQQAISINWAVTQQLAKSMVEQNAANIKLNETMQLTENVFELNRQRAELNNRIAQLDCKKQADLLADKTNPAIDKALAEVKQTRLNGHAEYKETLSQIQTNISIDRLIEGYSSSRIL